MEKNFKRTLVTTALPYANGPVHIGHLAGVYVPADIYTRYLRLRGQDVVMIGGSDEHGVPITIKAKAEGVTPQDIVDRYHNIIKDSFEGLGISFDVYSRTSSDLHSATASEFFRHLYDKGEFVEKTSMQLLGVGDVADGGVEPNVEHLTLGSLNRHGHTPVEVTAHGTWLKTQVEP